MINSWSYSRSQLTRRPTHPGRTHAARRDRGAGFYVTQRFILIEIVDLFLAFRPNNISSDRIVLCCATWQTAAVTVLEDPSMHNYCSTAVTVHVARTVTAAESLLSGMIGMMFLCAETLRTRQPSTVCTALWYCTALRTGFWFPHPRIRHTLFTTIYGCAHFFIHFD